MREHMTHEHMTYFANAGEIVLIEGHVGRKGCRNEC